MNYARFQEPHDLDEPNIADVKASLENSLREAFAMDCMDVNLSEPVWIDVDGGEFSAVPNQYFTEKELVEMFLDTISKDTHKPFAFMANAIKNQLAEAV